jgi:hypothetical protein
MDPSIEERADAATRKLGSIYNLSQRHSWDGPKLLAELIEKHGGIHVAPEHKPAMGRLFSSLLWGELAAWSVSADIALRLDDVEAKMAASSQVFDEARHFHTMRAYLWEADIELAPLSPYSRIILTSLLETDNLVHKIVGMQLMVESMAVSLFKSIAAANVEPVLTDLLAYFERDEARHVGLGVHALPKTLPGLSRLELMKLTAFQARLFGYTMALGIATRPAFEALGIDQALTQRIGLRMQRRVVDEMQAQRGGQGLVSVSKEVEGRLERFLYPEEAPEPGSLHKRSLDAILRAAQFGERLLS